MAWLYCPGYLDDLIKKINQNGLSSVFHYGNDGELLYGRDQAGNTKEYVWLEGRPLARIDNGTSIYYYHVDHLGTPQAMTNSAGAVVWKADYEPFGKATVKVSTVENNLRLPGQYLDRETGLHYNYFRDYEPGTGRYIQSDPIGLAGGMNLYAYVGDNPLTWVDPTGEVGVAGAVIFGGGVAWSAYSGYQASIEFNKAQQCQPRTDPNQVQNLDESGLPQSQEVGRRARTISNLVPAYGGGLLKAIWGVAAAGAGAANPYGVLGGLAGFVAGATYGATQSCTCQ